MTVLGLKSELKPEVITFLGIESKPTPGIPQGCPSSPLVFYHALLASSATSHPILIRGGGDVQIEDANILDAFIPPSRWKCPVCLYVEFAPAKPMDCHRCEFSTALSDSYSVAFTIAASMDGACLGCGSRGPSGQQCLECGGPIEPEDQSFHFQFGWIEGPRPDSPITGPLHPALAGPFAPPHASNFSVALVRQVISSVGGIFSELTPGARACFKGALERLDIGHLNRILQAGHTVRLTAVSALVTCFLSNRSPRMACIRANISSSQPESLVALLEVEARPQVFSSLISAEGSILVTVSTVNLHLSRLTSWAALRVAANDYSNPSIIPDPFQSLPVSELVALSNLATSEQSAARNHVISEIFSNTKGTLSAILRAHSSLPRLALLTMGHPKLMTIRDSTDFESIIVELTTGFIAAESRRLTILRAFVHLTQPCAMLAMILFAEQITRFDPHLNPEGHIISSAVNVKEVAEFIIVQAQRFVISRPVITESPDLDIEDDNLEEFRSEIVLKEILRRAPELFIPYTAHTQSSSRLPPSKAVRDVITSLLGRPLPWVASVWDGSIPLNFASLFQTYGPVTWGQSYYLYKHYNVHLGGPDMSEFDCPECGLDWAFYFSGSCPFCASPPALSLETGKRKQSVLRVVRCIGRAARAFKGLLESVKMAPALVESTYPVHILLMKGFSTLFLRQRDGTCDIGLRAGAGYSEDPFTVAAKLLADESNIQAKPSDFITIPGVTLPESSVLLYPSTDKDIWVRDTVKYVELEFVCCSTLENMGKIFPTSCFYHQLRGVVNYVLNDPSCHYRQILARCPICHSLGPRGSSCSHPSRPPFPRQETGIVGYLQGKQVDCNMCGHGD